MPVSKHRRHGKAAPRKPDREPDAVRQTVTTIDELRQAIASPALDFPAKAIVAGGWWFQQLLRKAGDRAQTTKLSLKDQRRAALLLCVAMDGEQGKNDDLSPVIADMLRPWCPVSSFAQGWEQANQMPPGTVSAMAARLLHPARKQVA